MPESLAFASSLPAYVYQNVAFDACVKLVDENKTIVTGAPKTLAVTVRFHDSYDIVVDQSDVLEVVTPGAIDPATGMGRVSVLLKALSTAHDARAFCLEVRAVESGVESVFSTPVTVVKEKLRIVQQPPDVWFKDEGGREKCMTVTLVLEPAPGTAIEDRVVPLDIRLLYEAGTLVAQQSILRLFPDMRPNMSRGRVTISFRIDDVSKNHQGQAFVLEVAPEKQESSLMFQDIAPARTSVIAIRSKRNKRKLQGTRPSPRSVAGTPRANLQVLAQPQPMVMMPMSTSMAPVGPSPAQRQRRMLMHGTPTNTQYAMLSHQPGSGRAADMSMAAQQQQSVSWANHVHQQQQHTPMHQQQHTSMHQQAHAATPMSSPAASAHHTSASAAAVEWKLAGFEIHADGSQNVSCPIYRCPQCKRLNDVESMSSGLAEHSPQCVFSSLLYRSQLEATAAQQQIHIHMAQQQQYLAAASASDAAARAYATPVSQPQQHTSGARSAGVSASIPPLDTDLSGAYPVDTSSAATPAQSSPKTLALLGHRVGQSTISPFMNRAAHSDESAGDAAGAGNAAGGSPGAGNLFASHAFRNQMEISEAAAALDKQTAAVAFLDDKPEHDPVESPHDNNNNNNIGDGGSGAGLTASHLSMEDNSVTLSVGVGTALFHEMSSMGISLEQFDKPSSSTGGGDGFNPLADFGGMSDEDQVFYILARMYTDAQNRKLGLPAFDQFQRMLGFYTESQNDAQTQVLFHALEDVGVPEKEQIDITNRFTLELQQNSDAVHSLPKYQHNLIMLREDALMYYWSQSLQSFGVN